MRIYCRDCGEKAVITKTNRLSLDVSEMYCCCTKCGHRFVWSAGFKHSLSPSMKEKSEMIVLLFKDLPETKKRDLLHILESDRA